MTIAQAVDLAAIILLALAVPVAGACYAWLAWRHGWLAIQRQLSPLALPLFGVFLALLVCYPFSVDRRYSAWRILQWTGYLAVFGLALAVPRRWVTVAAQAVGWPVAGVCLVEYLVTARRVRLLQGNPNTTAAWLLGLLFLGVQSGQSWEAWLWLLACCVAGATTESRGALAGLLAGAVTLGAPPGGDSVTTGRWGRVVVPVALAVVVAIVGVGVLAAWRPATVTNRLGTWREAVRLFLRRPLVGWGPGVYEVLAQNEPGHPHADNGPLTVAAEMGLVGLMAFAWVVASAGRLVVRSPDLARLGLVAFAVHNLVDSTLWWYWTGITMMAALAMVTREE